MSGTIQIGFALALVLTRPGLVSLYLCGDRCMLTGRFVTWSVCVCIPVCSSVRAPKPRQFESNDLQHRSFTPKDPPFDPTLSWVITLVRPTPKMSLGRRRVGGGHHLTNARLTPAAGYGYVWCSSSGCTVHRFGIFWISHVGGNSPLCLLTNRERESNSKPAFSGVFRT